MRNRSSARKSYLKEVRERFFQHKMAVVGMIALGIMLLIVIFLPVIMRLDPYAINKAAGFNKPPSKEFLLGTDSVGRDTFARLLFGGRISLFVGVASTLISLILGTSLGLVAGYYRGWAETVIMRLADVFMSFPATMLILVLVSAVGPSLLSVTLILGLLGWTQFARLVYSKVISVREMEYVESAQAVGAGSLRVMLKYILPNSFSPCLITMTFRMAHAMLTEASLSFLGAGVQPPTPSWGNMLHDAESVAVLLNQPWRWIPPGICLVITILSINFIGDGLRDALDPKMKI